MIAIDTNILVAFLIEKDSLHSQAVNVIMQIEGQEKWFNTLLLSELTTVILIKTKQPHLANAILFDLLYLATEKYQTRLEMVTQRFLRETSNIFREYSQQQLSLADCSLVAMARRRNIKTIATFDKGLRKAFRQEFKFLPTKLS